MNEEKPEEKSFHTPVLVDETLKFLLVDPSGTYVDGTIGGGGHAEFILERLSGNGRLIGIDRDKEALDHCRNRLKRYRGRLQLIHGDLGDLDLHLSYLDPISVAGIFLDLGISSHHIDTPRRGFSFSVTGPLDMRMDLSREKTARSVLNTNSEETLAAIIAQYGEERHARRIAYRIVQHRDQAPLETTDDLVEIIRRTTPPKWRFKTLARTFQAIRIEVNDEIEQLRMGMEKIVPHLMPGGRCVIISWESLMDRMVKRFFRGQKPTIHRTEDPESEGKSPFKILTKRVVLPTDEEVSANPRARSAKLRAAEKCDSGLKGGERNHGQKNPFKVIE